MRSLNTATYWILWFLGIVGNLTIVYGYMTGEFSDYSPVFTILSSIFFSATPILFGYWSERQDV